jgi:hypothetical protein
LNRRIRRLKKYFPDSQYEWKMMFLPWNI